MTAEGFISWDETQNGSVFLEYNKNGPVRNALLALEGGKIPAFKFTSSSLSTAGKDCSNRKTFYRAIVSQLKQLKRQGSSITVLDPCGAEHPFKLIFLIQGYTYMLYFQQVI